MLKQILKKVTPITYFFLLLIVLCVLHIVLPIKQIIFKPFAYSGVVLLVVGILINVWTDQLFRLGGTTVKPYEEPTTLLTDGPFRISRHPMYLGMVCMLLGSAIVLGSLIGIVIPLFFVLLAETLFIQPEEKALQKKFGKVYTQYKRKVRRWI